MASRRIASVSSGMPSMSAAASARCTLGLAERALEGAREGERGRGCRRDQRLVAERPRDCQRTLAPISRVGARLPVEGVHRERDHQRHGLRRGGVVESFERADEAGVRLLVAAEQLLHAGACRRQLQARRRARLPEAAGALRAGRRGHPRTGRSPPVRRRAPSGARLARPPARLRRARRRAAANQRAAVAGVRCAAAVPASAQDRDRGLVAVAGGALDVMHARRHRSSAGGQRLRAALVRAEAPAARRGVVDRSSHERVAEAEATRDVGRSHEVAAQQLVECRERGRLRDRRRRGHQLGLERVARDGRTLEYEAGAVREQRRAPRSRPRRRRAAPCRPRARPAEGRGCRAWCSLL